MQMKPGEEEREDKVRLGNVTQPFLVGPMNWTETSEEDEPEIRVSSCRATSQRARALTVTRTNREEHTVTTQVRYRNQDNFGC